MIPRLVRFFGGDPWRWLAELPLGIVHACDRMLPRLQAEEALAMADRVGLGTGSFSADDSRAMQRRWQEAAACQGTRQRAARPTPQQLAAIGIGSRRVPRVVPAHG